MPDKVHVTTAGDSPPDTIHHAGIGFSVAQSVSRPVARDPARVRTSSAAAYLTFVFQESIVAGRLGRPEPGISPQIRTALPYLLKSASQGIHQDAS